MARDRVNAGFGPSFITVTNSATSVAAIAASTWVRWGPFKGQNLVYQAVFGSATSGGRVKMQGTLTTATTAGVVSFVSMNSSGTGVQQYSGSTGTFAYVRVNSTAMYASGSVTVYFAAVN